MYSLSKVSKNIHLYLRSWCAVLICYIIIGYGGCVMLLVRLAADEDDVLEMAMEKSSPMPM